MIRWLVLFAAAFATASGLSMDQSRIPQWVQNSCYNVSDLDRRPLILGQRQPNAQSLDNFLSLVEKIEEQLERDRRLTSAEQVARQLLKRFHIDNLEYDSAKPLVGFSLHASEKSRIAIVSALLNDVQYEEFPEQVLTEDEKCSMYFMLSHVVNATAQEGDRFSGYLPRQQNQQQDIRMQNPADTRSPQYRGRPSSNVPVWQSSPSTYSARIRSTSQPREQGVVSFKYAREQVTAVSLNRVLLGFVAGVQNGAEGTMPLATVVQQAQHIPRPTVDLNSQINVLTAVTVADMLAIGAVDGNGKEMVNFGARGAWNDSSCTTEYRLTQDVNGTQATMAELRGALDGYSIGRAAREILMKNPKMRLSTLFRLYYSPSGFGSQGLGASVCSRGSAINELNQNLRNEAVNFLKLFSIVDREGAIDDSRIQSLISDMESGFTKSLRDAAMRSPEENEFCSLQVSGGSGTKYPCETKTDLFALIDMNTIDIPREMQEQLAQIIAKMDIRQQGGSVSLLTTSMGTDALTPLMALAYNSTNAGCPVCRTIHRDRTQVGSTLNDPAVMLQRLNETLMRFEQGKSSIPAVPGKAIVYWSQSGMGGQGVRRPDWNNWQFQNARRELHLRHRDTAIIAISANKEDVEAYVRNRDTDIFSPNDQNLVEKLVTRMCETPQIVQYPDCYQRASSEDIVTGYVSPGYVQYWAMYPEFFLKSYGIVIKFRAPNGLIRVCHDRYAKPELREWTCQEARSPGDELTFYQNNPCKSENVETCAPFYFSIIGRQGGTTQDSLCKDAGCKSGDQIQFQMSHTGIQCNSAFRKPASFELQLIGLLIALFIYFKN